MRQYLFYFLFGFSLFACSDIELVDTDRIRTESADSNQADQLDRANFAKLNREKQIDVWQSLTPKKKYDLWAQ